MVAQGGWGVGWGDSGEQVLEGGPDSDLLLIPWHNPQGHPTQPGTLDEDPACQQSIRSMKYSWRPCLDCQPPHQQHSASEAAASQITKPSVRPAQLRSKTCGLIWLYSTTWGLKQPWKPAHCHPDHTVHPAAPPGQGAQLEVPLSQETRQRSNSSTQSHNPAGHCCDGEHSLQIHSTRRGFRVLLVSPWNLGAQSVALPKLGACPVVWRKWGTCQGNLPNLRAQATSSLTQPEALQASPAYPQTLPPDPSITSRWSDGWRSFTANTNM